MSRTLNFIDWLPISSFSLRMVSRQWIYGVLNKLPATIVGGFFSP